MNCMNCGASITIGASICRKCGSTVESISQPSVQAGAAEAPQSPVNVIIQMGPGTQAGQAAQPIPAAPRSKIVAGLLGIFLGFLGIHRFYLGNNGLGIVQLLLTLLTCGYGIIITVPWGIIEGILILVGQIDRDGWGNPLKD
jgi:TM2 domain-containing membrane protein YozV